MKKLPIILRLIVLKKTLTVGSINNNKRVSNLIGKELFCQKSRCRIVAGLTRKYIFIFNNISIGKVAIGKARYLLNIVY